MRYAIPTYVVTATAGVGGSITPSGVTTLNAGDSRTYAITANSGVCITDVRIDGVSQGALTSYTFSNVASDHTISATFAAFPASAGNPVQQGNYIVHTFSSAGTFTFTPTVPVTAEVLVVGGGGAGGGAYGADVVPNQSLNFGGGGGAGGFVTTTTAVSGPTTVVVGAKGIGVSGGKGTSGGGSSFGTFVTAAGGGGGGAGRVLSGYVDGLNGGSGGGGGHYGGTSPGAIDGVGGTGTAGQGNSGAAAAGNARGGGGGGAGAASTNTNGGAGRYSNISGTDTPYAGGGGAGRAGTGGVGGGGAGGTSGSAPGKVATGYGSGGGGVAQGNAQLGSGGDGSDGIVIVRYPIPSYTITPTAGVGGTIAPSGVTTVAYATDVFYTFSANPHYYIMDVLVDGVSRGATSTYTFTSVKANHTISATFALDTFTITTAPSVNGTITPTSPTVDYGSNQTFLIQPDVGYHIVDVVVDGVPQGVLGSYTFYNVTTAGHTISATFALDTFTIATAPSVNGTITPTSPTVTRGSNQTFLIQPDSGYHIVDVVVDGVPQGALGSYTFYNVTADHTISATFALDTFTITAQAGPGGSIAPQGEVNVGVGEDTTFTITAEAGRHIADVVVDGESRGAIGSYTFTNVTADHTISATFALDTFTITTAPSVNGTITPTSPSIAYGEDAVVTITPDAGYHIADVVVDGESRGAIGSYTFTNVTADHTISATFALDTFTITTEAGSGGSISPPGPISVDFGGSAAFTIAPDMGYHITNVIVDGVSQAGISSYTFTDVAADHTIAATFAADTYDLAYVASAGGTISGPAAQTVAHGSDGATVTAVADAGRHFVGWDDLVLSPERRDLAVTADATYTALFAADTYALTYAAGAGGTVSGTSPQTVEHGSDGTTVTAVPDAGFRFVRWTDGVTTAERRELSVTGDVTVSAVFAEDFVITASAGPGGSIAPAGDVTVTSGADQAFAITADAGYSVQDVAVDGVSQGPLSSYTFTERRGRPHHRRDLRRRHLRPRLRRVGGRHDLGPRGPDGRPRLRRRERDGRPRRGTPLRRLGRPRAEPRAPRPRGDGRRDLHGAVRRRHLHAHLRRGCGRHGLGHEPADGRARLGRHHRHGRPRRGLPLREMDRRRDDRRAQRALRHR